MANVIDAKGHHCPIPVLKARRAIANIDIGDELTILATDPASVIDFKHFCNSTGNELVDWSHEDGVFTYTIRKTE